MSWLIALPMLLAAIFMNNDTLLLASGLFAIAGSIDVAFHEPISDDTEDKK
jgi:hypothetical protein